jgi:DNA-binding transcriptional ArsR family regulator
VTLLLRFRSEDLLQCRFAISPLNETADALRSLSVRSAQPYHLPWQRQARHLVPGLGIGPLLAILALRGYQPDFLNPAPDSPFTEIDAELDRVRATSPAKVAAELAECLDGQPHGPQPGHGGPVARRDYPELAGDPAQVRDLLAGMLHRAWSALIEPWWPRLRDVLDADITYRARRLADSGIAAALGELDPRVSWGDGAVRFSIRGTREIDVSGSELVLMPSVFAWPGAAVNFDPPAVIYPARGVFGIWQPGSRSADDLARLTGKTRAALLAALAEPASTTGLAARTSIPVSSVSEHLAVLRATGLVASTRTGRFLVHQRTALGTALAGGLDPRLEGT